MIRVAVPVVDAASCPAVGSPDLEVDGSSSSTILEDATNHAYNGTFFTPTAGGSNRTICRVGWELTDQGATLAGKHFYTKIFTMSGDNLNQSPDHTPVPIENGTSDALDGANNWDAMGWRYCEWSGNKPTLTAGTKYAITLTLDTIDAQAPAWGYLNSESGEAQLTAWYIWMNTGDLHSSLFSGYGPSIRIYYYD